MAELVDRRPQRLRSAVGAPGAPQSPQRSRYQGCAPHEARPAGGARHRSPGSTRQLHVAALHARVSLGRRWCTPRVCAGEPAWNKRLGDLCVVQAPRRRLQGGPHEVKWEAATCASRALRLVPRCGCPVRARQGVVGSSVMGWPRASHPPLPGADGPQNGGVLTPIEGARLSGVSSVPTASARSATAPFLRVRVSRAPTWSALLATDFSSRARVGRLFDTGEDPRHRLLLPRAGRP